MLRGASRGGSAADQGASWTPLCGGIWDKSKWEETPQLTGGISYPIWFGNAWESHKSIWTNGRTDGRTAPVLNWVAVF